MDDERALTAGIPRALRGKLMVAGVAGGVGTTTVATALGAMDRGLFTGRIVEVLVCRPTAESLVRAARAAYLVSLEGGEPPVVAVSNVDASGPSRPSAARMRLLEPHTAVVVVLPYVRRWRDMAIPLDDITDLLSRPPAEMPRALRRYAATIREVNAVLDGPPPPARAHTGARHPSAARPTLRSQR